MQIFVENVTKHRNTISYISCYSNVCTINYPCSIKRLIQTTQQLTQWTVLTDHRH